MNYDVFLGALVDELEKAASEDEKEEREEKEEKSPAERLKEKLEKRKEKKEEKEDEGEKEAMSSLEESFFAGLYDELEKHAGWRALSGAAKQRFMSRAKASIGGARRKAAENLLWKGKTGTGGFTQHDPKTGKGSLRVGRVKGTDQVTVGRVRTGRAKRIMGRHGLGKGKPGAGTYSIPGLQDKGVRAMPKAQPAVAQPKKAAPPAAAATGTEGAPSGTQAAAAKIPARRGSGRFQAAMKQYTHDMPERQKAVGSFFDKMEASRKAKAAPPAAPKPAAKETGADVRARQAKFGLRAGTGATTQSAAAKIPARPKMFPGFGGQFGSDAA